ncbi:VWFA and cache domain-containing protein 1-like isoform X3 [Dreissena polymorpha]|uniref:VWFA and cache domain-containing protein 1-like isoform X3 n=1 Tax=Dreissena polymorpha TaxID=45954 RepID=UPI002264F3F0|nr:VWFA and cache domain-containing protein 1-like isoform X3 [Dreissena polymorpha]
MTVFTIFALVLLFLIPTDGVELKKDDLDRYVTMLKERLDSHVERLLDVSGIEKMIAQYETNVAEVPVNVTREFEEIFEKVTVKYNDLVIVANSLKKYLEGMEPLVPPLPRRLRHADTLNGHENDPDKDDTSVREGLKDTAVALNSPENDQEKDGSNIREGLKGTADALYSPENDLEKKGSSIREVLMDTADGRNEHDDMHKDLSTTIVDEISLQIQKGSFSQNIDEVRSENESPRELPPFPKLKSDTKMRLKRSSLELEPPIRGPPKTAEGSLKHCCQFSYKGKYSGKVREEILQEACGVNVSYFRSLPDKLQGLQKQFQENYDRVSVLGWQYFIEADGGYMQYPANTRHCIGQDNNNFDSVPWLIEKHHMERKNLVIIMGDIVDPIVMATRNVLNTLTSSDKVYLVDSHADEVNETERYCMKAYNQRIRQNIEFYLDLGSKKPRVPFNLHAALEKAYTVFQKAKNRTQSSFKQSNLVLLLLSGNTSITGTDQRSVLTSILQNQQRLENSVQHFVYWTGAQDPQLTKLLAQVADQNNGKLNETGQIAAQPWPMEIVNGTVGKEGIFEVVQEDQFADTVGKYFKRLPPQIDTQLTTMLSLSLDDTPPSLSVTVPVYNETDKPPIGLVGADGYLADIFSDIVEFDVGHKSYAYLLDADAEKLLIHPKMGDPNRPMPLQPLFRFVEDGLNDTERLAILTASVQETRHFIARLPGISLYVEGELVPSEDFQGVYNASHKLEPATVYYRKLYGTSLVVVLVHFLSESIRDVFQKTFINQNLHVVYHRLDSMFGSPYDNVLTPGELCHLDGHFLSYKQSVVKLSPFVFKDPNVYKFSQEDTNAVRKLNDFITKGTSTDLIKPEKRSMILHTLLATDSLDALWENTSKEVIERFYGSETGVFRMYPGSPMLNTFDHRQTKWYKRSLMLPHTTHYHIDKLSFISRQEAVIITRGVINTQGKVVGVAGMTVSKRFLTSQLSHATECFGEDYVCHLMDPSGQIIDSFPYSEASNPESILTQDISFLAHALFCASFTGGYAKRISNSRATTDLHPDPARWIFVEIIPNSNLFLLVKKKVQNNTQTSSDDKFSCHGCRNSMQVPGDNSRVFNLTGLPVCDYKGESPSCHVHCYTSVCAQDLPYIADLSCNEHLEKDPIYNLVNNGLIGTCYTDPIADMQFPPNAPGPNDQLDKCPIPCAAIDDMDICQALIHCEASTDTYPSCVWKDNPVNISRYLPSIVAVPTVLPQTSHVTGKLTSQDYSLISPLRSDNNSPVVTNNTGASSSSASSTSAVSLSSVSTSTASSASLSTSPLSSATVSTVVSSASLSTVASSATVSTVAFSATISTLKPPAVSVMTAATVLTAAAAASSPVAPLQTSEQSSTKSTGSQSTTTVPVINTKNLPIAATDIQTTSQPASRAVTTTKQASPSTTWTLSLFPSKPGTIIDLAPSSASGPVDTVGGPTDSSGMSPGSVVALVIGLIVAAGLVTIVGVKLYQRKYSTGAGKYDRRGSSFSSVLFSRNQDSVTIETPDSRTPYQELSN